MITNLHLPRRLHWHIVLAALTCVSASQSTVEPTAIFAGSSAPKHPLGVVNESDAQSKRFLRANSNTTKSMADENEDRVLIPESSVASAVDQNVAAKVDESVEAKLREVGDVSEVSAKDPVIAEKAGEVVEAGLLEAPGDHIPAAKVDESVEAKLRKAVVIPGASASDDAAKKLVENGVAGTSVPQILQNAIDQHFDILMEDYMKLYKDPGSLFKNDEYAKWSNWVLKKCNNEKSKAEVAKVSTLLRKYETDAVISMVAAGKKDPTTQLLAIKLELVLLAKWNADRNWDNIMNLLTFGKDRSEVLMGMPLLIWGKHLRTIGKDPYDMFVIYFTKRYGDKELAELLVVAAADDRKRKFVHTMEAHQMKIWKNKNKGVIGSFVLLELHKVPLDTLLKSPILNTWISYVEILGLDPHQVLLFAMRNRVGDEKLDSILAAAKADGANERIWSILLQIQEEYKSIKREYPEIEKWQRSEKSGDDIFDFLELPGKGKDMFETKEWDKWVAYLTILEKQKQKKDQTGIAAVTFSVLKNRFSGEDLAKLVATAKTVERTKELAAEWERREWRIALRTPDQVFGLLKLKEKGDAVFESPEFISWALYVKKLNSARKNRNDNIELAYQLYRHYGNDVGRMLEQAGETAKKKNDEVTEAFVNDMSKVFVGTTPLEENLLKRTNLRIASPDEKSLKKKKVEETSLDEMSLDEMSLDDKWIGKRLRTSPPAMASDSSKRTKVLDEPKPPTGN